MDINEKISYKWPFVWNAEDMGQKEPEVNRLLKAIIEKNINEMNSLFLKGATIQGINKSTFQRAIFHLLGEYDVVKCLVEHGFIGIFDGFDDRCIEPETYSWGILARAWSIGSYNGNYDVFELLAKSGFSNMHFCSRGQGYEGEDLIVGKNDIRAAVILMENGYDRSKFLRYQNKYPGSDVIRYLIDHPVIHRKSIALDDFKFREIPYPQLETPGFFHRKRTQENNSLLIKDYEDRVEAQNQFKRELGESNWDKISKNKLEGNKEFFRLLHEINKSKGFVK